MKSATSHPKPSKVKAGAPSASKKVKKAPTEVLSPQTTVVTRDRDSQKAVEAAYAEAIVDPIERVAFYIGVEEGKAHLSDDNCGRVTQQVEANIILELIEAGELSLLDAERHLVRLQTAARDGVPIDAAKEKRAVAEAIEAAHSIVESSFKACVVPTSAPTKTVKKKSK